MVGLLTPSQVERETSEVAQPDLVKLLEKCSNDVRVVGIVRLLAQEVVVGFLARNKSLVLLLEKSLTL